MTQNIFQRFDHWICRAVFSFLNPFELAAAQATCTSWHATCITLWRETLNFKPIRLLTYKYRYDLGDKLLALKAWKNNFSSGAIAVIGGCKDHFDAVQHSCFAFKDNTAQFDIIDFPSDNFPGNLSACSTAIDGMGRLHCIGGWTGQESTKHTRILDFVDMRYERTWNLGVDYPILQCFSAGTTTTTGDIFVCGGGSTMWQGADVFSKVFIQKHSDIPAEWFELCPMSSLRCGHVAVTFFDGKIMALGGYGGTTSYLKSTEIYDINTNRWIESTPMNIARTGLGACIGTCGSVYAVGGSSNGIWGHASIERLDPREGKFKLLPDMKYQRAYTSACFSGCGHILYTLGGISLDMNIGTELEANSIEWFDTRIQRWSEIPMSIDCPLVRSGDISRADHQMLYILS